MNNIKDYFYLLIIGCLVILSFTQCGSEGSIVDSKEPNTPDTTITPPTGVISDSISSKSNPKSICPDICPIVILTHQVSDPDDFLLVIDYLNGTYGVFTAKDQKIVSAPGGVFNVKDYGQGDFQYNQVENQTSLNKSFEIAGDSPITVKVNVVGDMKLDIQELN